MPRKNDEHEPELEGIAKRLRAERPEASPLELDQIKLSAMSRAKATAGRANPRRLVVAALTVGLMAAGTGGVLAAGGTGSPAGNAAQAQYSSTTIACGDDNGNGNVGEGNGNENGNFNCNNNSFNNNNNTTNNTNTTDVTNNYTNSTVTISGTESVGTGAGGVQATSTTKKVTTSGRKLKIHVNLPRKARLRRVSVSVNGKHLKTVIGKKASDNIVLTDLPCGSGATTVTVTITLSSGKTVSSTHTYHLCT